MGTTSNHHAPYILGYTRNTMAVNRGKQSREAADALLNRIEPGDALLVKASRGMALEKVLEIFYAEQKDAEE